MKSEQFWQDTRQSDLVDRMEDCSIGKSAVRNAEKEREREKGGEEKGSLLPSLSPSLSPHFLGPLEPG